jgi:cell division protein FtsB
MLYNECMIQDQLVEYVSSQMKLGVSRDAIKAALAGAGWAPVDVEDTLKKVEGLAKPAAPVGMSTAPMSVSTKPASSVTSASFSPSSMTQPGTTQPQSIKVSDLVSASPAAIKNAEMKRPETKNANMQPIQPMKPIDLKKLSTEPEKKGGIVMKIIGVVLIVALAALAGFLYWQNSNLTAKVATIGGTSTDIAASVASLTAQVQAQDASNTELAAEVASFTATNALLQTNLSFVATPSGAATSSETVSVSGKLSVVKAIYTITTPYGVLVSVQNSKDAKVIAALTALATSTDPVNLTGTHVPGSQFITVTSVNGMPL